METGLTTEQVRINQTQFGKNRIATNESFSLVELFFSQFVSLINAVLAIAALFSFIVHDFVDGVFILAVIIINACFGFIQEYRAEKSLEKLKNYTAPTAHVTRDGHEMQIMAEELVSGDLVNLDEGARIPADGTIITVANLEVDESVLTGESLSVVKEINETVFLGTLVNRGNAQVRVTHIGMQTRFGQIANTLSNINDEKTPLQKDFDRLGKTLSFIALFFGFLVLPIGLLHHQSFFPLLLVAASISIAAIPEGLPAVVTIAFAVGTHRMAKRNAIVRKMAAIETLGAIQVVLVDKTGTITQNSMAVKHLWLKEQAALPLLLRSCVLGNTASIVEKGDGAYEIVGDQTDGALLLWARKHEHFAKIPAGEVLDEFVFDSDSKTITTLWKQAGQEFIFVRGAPETIIQASTLSEEEKAAATAQFETFAKEGLRTIGFAVRSETHLETKDRAQLEKNLTFLGFLALYDPPRPEIKEAIQKARTAGIHVCMVTGDNEFTALSLAKEINLIEKDEDVISGEDLEKLSDEQLAAVILKTRVFTRTKPEQKLRIATLLQEKGMVVGVTGDGVNDALALKKADVGVAMGKKGTDVAKEASDMILADDNFATLVHAIEEGRVIYKNIVNAILYLLSGNLAEISLVLFATILNLPFPLLPTQILWMNLVTDSLPALALAIGSRDGTVLLKKPRDPKKGILLFNRIMLIFIIGFGLSEFLVLYFSSLLQTHSVEQARTIIFDAIIFCHLIIVLGFGWHSLKKGNTFLIFTVVLIAILQLLITFVPFLQHIFHMAI